MERSACMTLGINRVSVQLFAPTKSFDSTIRFGRRAIPVDVLDVIIHLDRQLLPPLGATILQDFATTFGFHPRPKAVNAFAAALLGLISAFRHVSIISSSLGAT